MTGGRIEIDPEGLRLLATKLRGAAAMLSETGRALGTRSSPPMPAPVAALVTEVVVRANSELQDLALELHEEAQGLVARATWAELGGGDVAWLLPGPYRFRAPAAGPLAPDAVLVPVTDDEIMRAERWATDLLDGMGHEKDGSAQEAARLGVGDAPGAQLLRFADGYAAETLLNTVGSVIATDIDLDARSAPGSDVAAVGALGSLVVDPSHGASVLGLSAGLIVGSGDGFDEESR